MVLSWLPQCLSLTLRTLKKIISYLWSTYFISLYLVTVNQNNSILSQTVWYRQGHASHITLPSAVMIILLSVQLLLLFWAYYDFVLLFATFLSVITTAIYLYIMSITVPWEHSYNSLSKVYKSFSQVRSDDVVNLINKKMIQKYSL